MDDTTATIHAGVVTFDDGTQVEATVAQIKALPDLLKALRDSQLVLMEFGGKDDERYTRERRAAYQQNELALAKSNLT